MTDDAPRTGFESFDDPAAALARKIRITKVMAVIECVSYAALLVPMTRKYLFDNRTNSNYVLLRIIAYFHGIICVAFAVMVIDIFRAMRWKWWFVLVTFLGPPGALVAHWRLRTQPTPTDVTHKMMLF